MPPCALAAIPTRNGPTKPPSEPMEVTSAIPDAAATPVRKSLGSDHNGALTATVPITANVQSVIENNEELVALNRIKAVPAAISGMAIWYRRSSLRSELREASN